jgi:ADP-ribose pyrophosphatase YjhB (NUDIX family)
VRVLVARAAHRVFLLQPLGGLFLLALGGFGLLVHATILPDVGELETWRRCPQCGADLEHEEGDAKVECPECGFRHYAHSQVTACAVVVDARGRVLLTRRAGPPYEGYWDLPGGFVGEAEHPNDALKRELREETGLDVEPGRLIGIWIDRYAERGEDGPATMNLYFTASASGGEGEPSDDVAELRWVEPDEFPPRDELAFHIGEVLETWRNEHP